jgi:hypothetical protein
VSIRKKANPPVNNNTQTNAALRQTLAVQKESSQLSGKIRTSVPGLRSSEFGENERAGGTASKRILANQGLLLKEILFQIHPPQNLLT